MPVPVGMHAGSTKRVEIGENEVALDMPIDSNKYSQSKKAITRQELSAIIIVVVDYTLLPSNPLYRL